VIQHEMLAGPVGRITLKLKAEEIPVTFGEILWMRQLPPTFGATLDPAAVASTLELERADLDDNYPVQEVSTGLPTLIVPLQNLGALQRCRLRHDRYLELVENIEAKSILVFCPEPHESADLSARMFAPSLGVTEDPATGSANGCLAGYLVEHRYFRTDSIDVRVEQGYEIDRPSLLYLQAARDGDEIRVDVGGRVQMVAKGELV
jgi:trans-2,3-dihydro-3-hydroxyanthranilate isomerase